jgi:hypothetical protein
MIDHKQLQSIATIRDGISNGSLRSTWRGLFDSALATHVEVTISHHENPQVESWLREWAGSRDLAVTDQIVVFDTETVINLRVTTEPGERRPSGLDHAIVMIGAKRIPR